MPPARTQVTLDFELDSEPIAGSCRGADGITTAFNGWIELVSLLQAVATTRQRHPAQPLELVQRPARPQQY